MKKVLCIIISLVLLSGILTVPVFAADGADSDGFENDGSVHTSYRFGDLDGDGYVKVNDARLCLRIAANIEPITSEQFLSTLFMQSSNGRPTTGCARKIMRVATKSDVIESFKMYTGIHSKYVMKNLPNDGGEWVCNDTGKAVTVTKTVSDDGRYTQFEFYANASGETDIELKLMKSDTNGTYIADEIDFTLYVPFLMGPGELNLEGMEFLMDYVNGRSDIMNRILLTEL